MKKFEYLSKSIEILADVDKLNKLGDNGWELVTVCEEMRRVIFKRAVSTDALKEWGL